MAKISRKIDTPPNSFIPGEVGDLTFLSMYRKYVDRISDAPKSFVELSGLFCLSAIAKNLVVRRGSDMKTNLFFMLVGPSTFGRKGTMSKAISEMLMNYMRTEEPVLPYKDVGIDASPEGFLQAIKEKNEHAYVIAEEYSSELSRYIRKEHYKSTMLQNLIKIYDGSPVQHTISNQERSVNLRDPHVAMFCDIQPEPLSDLMCSDFIDKGFFQRFIISHDRVWNEKPPAGDSDENYDIALSAKSILRCYSEDLKKMGKLVASFDVEAEKQMLTYVDQFMNMAKERPDINSFFSRSQGHLMKLSALYALNDFEIPVWEPGKAFITIKKSHVDCAYDLVMNSLRSWDAFIPFISKDEMQRNKQVMFYLLEQSEKRGEDYLNLRDVFSDVGLTELAFGKMIDTVKLSDGLVAIDIEQMDNKKPLEDCVIDIDDIRMSAKKRLSKIGFMIKTNYDRLLSEKKQISMENAIENIAKQINIKSTDITNNVNVGR